MTLDKMEILEQVGDTTYTYRSSMMKFDRCYREKAGEYIGLSISSNQTAYPDSGKQSNAIGWFWYEKVD